MKVKQQIPFGNDDQERQTQPQKQNAGVSPLRRTMRPCDFGRDDELLGEEDGNNRSPAGMTTRNAKAKATAKALLVGGDGGGGGGGELCYAFDHVAYGAEGTEGFVGNLDVEGFLDLEGDVDLVEGVDVELVEGAGQGDGVRRNAL